MQLTIDIKESAIDKIMYLLDNLKPDVKIIDSDFLDIEIISENDKDYTYILDGKKERKSYPSNYGTISDINWH